MTRTPTIVAPTVLALTAMALFGPADLAGAQVATNPWAAPAPPPVAAGGNPFSGRSAYAAPQYATPQYGAPTTGTATPAYPPAAGNRAAYGQQTYPGAGNPAEAYRGQPYGAAPSYGAPAYPAPYAVPDYRPEAGTTGQQAPSGDPALSGYGTAYGTGLGGAPLTGTFGNPYSSLYPGTGALAGLGYGIPLTGGYLPGLGLAAPGGWQSPGYYPSPYSGSLAPFYTPYATGLPGLGGLGPWGM